MLGKHRPNIADYALLIGLAAVFGSSFLFTNLAVQTIPPVTVVAGRIVLAAIAICIWLWVRKEALPTGRVWYWIFASALFGNAIPFSLISWGQKNVDAGLTAIFMAIMPLTTVLLAHCVTTDEKLNRWTFAGVCFGLVGVVVLMGWQTLSQVGSESLSQFAILLGAMCYAVNALITRKLTHLSKWPMSAGLLLAATLLTVPLAIVLEVMGAAQSGVASVASGAATDIAAASLSEAPTGVGSWIANVAPTSVVAVVILAAGPTALATWMILVIIDRQSASFLSQINFMVPLFGVLFGTVFLQERLPANAWVALLVILFGVALARRGSR